MELDLAGFVANDLYCLDKHYESATLRLWESLARESEVVVDIGSHIGTFALLAADANPHARVIAVEADPSIFQHLNRHAAKYPSLTTLNAAISDQAGVMWFERNSANDGAGRLVADQPPAGTGIEVQTRTLCELCSALHVSHIDLVKLDVEGCELQLLTGQEAFWQQHRPRHVIAEITIPVRDRTTLQTMLSAMESRGYTAKRLQNLHFLPMPHKGDLANWHFARQD